LKPGNNICLSFVENGITNLETKDGLSSDSLHKPMLKGMISHPSSITSQIAPGTPELWSFNCPKFYQISDVRSISQTVFIESPLLLNSHFGNLIIITKWQM